MGDKIMGWLCCALTAGRRTFRFWMKEEMKNRNVKALTQFFLRKRNENWVIWSMLSGS